VYTRVRQHDHDGRSNSSGASEVLAAATDDDDASRIASDEEDDGGSGNSSSSSSSSRSLSDDGDSSGTSSSASESDDDDNNGGEGGDGGGDDDSDEGPGLADPAMLGTGRAALELNKSHLAFLHMANNDGFTEKQADHVLALLRTLPAEHERTFPRRIRPLMFAAERADAERHAQRPGAAGGTASVVPALAQYTERVYTAVDGYTLRAACGQPS
jgi:hypothetical protein